MSTFALKDFYILTEDLKGEYVRKIRLYKEFYEAMGQFIVLNDEWFEISFFISAHFDQIDEPEMSIGYAAQALLNDMVYSTTGDELGSDGYNKPSSLMTLEKRQNIEALFAKHQSTRKAQYEEQMAGRDTERPFYALHVSANNDARSN